MTQEYLLSKVKNLELDLYEEDVPEELHTCIVVPDHVQLFVSDIHTKKIVLPNSVCVIDLHNDEIHNLEINLPNSLKHINIRRANLLNKNLYELFSDNLKSFRFNFVQLDGVDLSSIINSLYDKYFNELPKYTLNYGMNRGLKNNVVSSRIHKNIIDYIFSYESNLKKAKEFIQTIKEELLMKVYHPDRVEKMLNQYGFDFIECL